MKPSQITQALQLHFLGNPNPESLSFYEEFIQGLPYSESIASFKIAIDTNNNAQNPGSNFTIITFDEPFINETINEYIEKTNDDQEIGIQGYHWTWNHLIISFPI
jgi:hypothetical protein